MFVAPFANWRRVSVREHRTGIVWPEYRHWLGGGNGTVGDARFCGCGKSHGFIGQLERSHEGFILHAIRAGVLPQDIASLRVCLYAGSWQLVAVLFSVYKGIEYVPKTS